jgi:hypothetical protein
MLYTSTLPTGSITGTFQLFVQEAPQIVGHNSAIFQIGLANSSSVVTTGFPKLAIPGRFNPMRVTVQGTLPPGVSFTDTDSLGVPTGNGLLSGKPAAGSRGSYPLTFTANNGVGTAATQSFNLQVIVAGDVNNDGVVNCADIDALAAAFGYYEGNPRYNPLADLNSDGVVNFADLNIVEGDLPAGLACPFSYQFGTMSATLGITGSQSFNLDTAFTLNPLSNGVNLATDPISFQVGTYNVTIPGGSFVQLQNGAKQGTWVFDGKIAGLSISAQILPLGGNSFQVKASGSGANLSALANPIVVRVGIGDDSGKISVNATRN